jgi:hypothetical protein
MIDKVKSLQWFPFDKKAADKPAPNIEPYNKAKVNMAINLPLTLEGVISANIVAASLNINNFFLIKKFTEQKILRKKLRKFC